MVVPLSGGLDSAALLFSCLEAGSYVFPLFVNYGHRAAGNEECAARAIVAHAMLKNRKCALLRVVSLPLNDVSSCFALGRARKWSNQSVKHQYIPGRNMFIASAALLYAQEVKANEISFAFVRGMMAVTDYPDTGKDFVGTMQAVSDSRVFGKVTPLITAPFMRNSKVAMASIVRKHGLNTDVLWTCVSGARVSCRRCMSCISLDLALK